MIAGFLLDEDLPQWWRRALVYRCPDIRIMRVGDATAPPLKAPDPLILDWCVSNPLVLLTNNRSSMPQHLSELLVQGRHIEGIFLVDPTMSIQALSATLLLIVGASFEGEYRDQIRYLPVVFHESFK